MSEIFFVADSHFSHSNIIKYCNRPFLNPSEKSEVDRLKREFGDLWSGHLKEMSLSKETVQLHNKTILNNINESVKENDILWVLGDFCWGRETKDAQKWLNIINCRNINLIRGNHDSPGCCRAFRCVRDLFEIKIEGQSIILCHFAMRVWNKSHHNSYHLYGHSHSQLPEDPLSLSFDVGVDGHDFKPWSFEEVKEKMEKKIENGAHGI